MTIILANGDELTPITVTGGKKVIQGASRDVLNFVFSADTSLDVIDAHFTAENCETIIIEDGESAYVHNAYTIRAELKREPVEVVAATETEEAVYENRVTVSMAQRTYTESQLASLTDTVDVLVMESLSV